MAYFYQKDIKEQVSDVSESDLKTYRYMTRPTKEMDEALFTEKQTLDVILQLSDLRVGLICWYDFSCGAEILEVNAGFGALTGYLCQQAVQITVTEENIFRAKALYERYQDMDNLAIYAGDLWEQEFTKKFDYILLTGVLESQDKCVEYLKKIQRLLKPAGKILIAVDNRCGLKYFCGEREPHTKRIFAGLNRYQDKSNGQCFSRQELINILDEAGLSYHKFYYPLPDYRLPQVIYSENYLPDESVGERVNTYYQNRNTLILSENKLYQDVVSNHVFEFFANSFFVECCNISGSLCAVDYAAVTADRGRENGMVTKIYGEIKVEKKPLYVAGEKSVRRIHENMQNLKQHGIEVLKYQYLENKIVMPYIKAPTLGLFLRKLSCKGKQMVLDILDSLWEQILNSSEYTEAKNNALLEYGERADWGPILQYAYIEMMPMNCFYDEGKFVFFDQEFVRYNYPARYIMFRTIHYSTEYLKKIISLEELQKRYGLADLWDIFIKEEVRFLNEIRNYEVYQKFYSVMGVDNDCIKDNLMRLELFENKGNDMGSEKYSCKELYSFDVFDTLITRRTATPKGIFALLQEELNSQDGAFPRRIKENFYDLRRYYENMTSREMCDAEIGDITLTDIYRVLGKGEQLNQEQISALADMERFLEYENIVGIPENIEEVKKLKKQGKRVILISNMYMEEEILRKLLVIVDSIFQDIPIYVSSKYKKRKETQQLYEVVKKKEKVDFINWVHCGDDRRADIDVPASLGIKTVYFNGAALTEQEKKVIYAQEKDIELQMNIGRIKNARVLARGFMGRREAIPVKHYGMAEDFPCGILHGRVALYGAGKCGQDLHKKLKDYAHVEIVVWVDKNFIAAQNKGLPVVDPRVLFDSDFDDIIIAISNTAVADEVKEQLISLGIDKHKIVHFI